MTWSDPLGHLADLNKLLQTKTISKDSNRHYLNFNILEATIADLFLGNSDNAGAGMTLIQHPVGGKTDSRTKAGAATVGETRGYPVIELRPDLPKEWADLYTVWNLAFCSNASTFPILAAKLLIPSVHDHDSNSEGYMYHRAIALYLHFQFQIFRKIDETEPSVVSEWNFPEITRTMGQANAVSAQAYDELVKSKKTSRFK